MTTEKDTNTEQPVTPDHMSRVDSLDTHTIWLIQVSGMTESQLAVAREDAESWSRIQRRIAEHKRMQKMAEHHTRQKAIQDPVHGPIMLAPWELDLVSTWEMLRLRYVMQLGPAHIIYPGATHSRFQHCLGTDFLAQRCINITNYCETLSSPCFKPLSQLLNDYYQKVFRAASLLHDVGHPPTSHTIEQALRWHAELDHTDLGEFLILHSGITEVLERHDIRPMDVVHVIKRRSKDPILTLLSDFLDSPLDIDKTDYLIRDAHFSGVQLGIFPAERVLLTNRVVRDEDGRWVRAFMLKALHSLESLILSRNWMFSDLYLHHAVRIAEAMTNKATLFRMREENMTRKDCVGLFTRMTDYDLYRWLESSEIEMVREYADRIRHRCLFKMVLSRPLSSYDHTTREELLRLIDSPSSLQKIESELANDEKDVIVDILDLEIGERMFGEVPILLGSETSGFTLMRMNSVQDAQPILTILQQQKQAIPAVRIYSDPILAESIRKKFDTIFPPDDNDIPVSSRNYSDADD